MISCEEEYSPKPKGYFRIDLPERKYVQYDKDCPFTFKNHEHSFVMKGKEDCWLNVYYPDFNCTIHLSYKKVNNNINQLFEDSRSLVYKHTVKANDISERLVINDSANVYGLVYELEGNAASFRQFYLTDSTNHFVRGAMYFNVASNYDSLAPVINYLSADIDTFINSFKWK